MKSWYHNLYIIINLTKTYVTYVACHLSYNLTVPIKRKMLLPLYTVHIISEVVRENMEYSIPQLCSLTRLKGSTLSLVCK